MKILIIEDDPVYLQVLEIFCQKFGGVFKLTQLDNLKATLSNLRPDFIVSDIHIDRSSSIELFKMEEYQVAPILFVSNSDSLDRIMESLEIPFSLFLKKPLEPISLEIHLKYLIREFRRFRQLQLSQPKEGILVKGKFNQDLRVPYSDILYVESDRNYVTLHLTSGKISTFKYSLTKFVEDSPPHFIRIGKSIIINVLSSSKWRANPHFFYYEKKVFPIGKTFQLEVINQLKSMYLPFEYDEI